MPRPAPSAFGPAALAATLLAVAMLAPSAPATADTFRAWQAECTASGICLLVNRASGADGAEAVLALRRGPEAGEPWQLLVTPLEPPADLSHPFALWVDSGPRLTFSPGYDFRSYGAPDNLFLINSGLATRLLGMLAGGASATLAWEPDGGGGARVEFALPGLADGLAFIDARQGRSDADRSVAAPLDLEPHASMADLRPAVDGGQGAHGLPGGVLEQHYGVHGCESLDTSLMAATPPVEARLSDTAVLYVVPCTATAGRVYSRLYVVETGEIGGIEALAFARYGATHGWTGTDTLVDVTVDPGRREIESRSRERDIDGCGHAARWQWRGVRFALVEYRYRQTCSGPDDPAAWPLVFSLAG